MTVYQSSMTPRAAQAVIPAGTERVEGPYYPLRAMVARAERSGELTRVTSVRRLPNGRGEVDVIRHRAPRSPWVARSVVGALVLTPLFAFGYMIKMIVDSFAALELTGSAVGVLFLIGMALFTVAMVRRRAESRPWIEGTFRARAVK